MVNLYNCTNDLERERLYVAKGTPGMVNKINVYVSIIYM